MRDPAHDGGPVRVALIGFGRAGRTIHTPLILDTPGLELAIVASSRPEHVHADLPHVTVASSPAGAWTDPAVDVVVIATPPATHVSLAAAALGAGRHVVVDKPLAVSLDDARELSRTASRAGRLLVTFQNRRWDGDFLALERLIASGVLGEVAHVESHFDRYRPVVLNRWREQPGAGSGVWSDLGPHLVDQALRLFGLPDSVTGSLAAHRADAQTDDWAHVVLAYARRAVILHASMLAAAPVPRFTVHGSRASWIKHGLDPQEVHLAARMRVDVGGPVPSESAVLVDGVTGIETETPIPPGAYGRFYAELRDAVIGNGINPVPLAQAIGTTAVCETAARSSRERRSLSPPLTDEERAAFSAAEVKP